MNFTVFKYLTHKLCPSLLVMAWLVFSSSTGWAGADSVEKLGNPGLFSVNKSAVQEKIDAINKRPGVDEVLKAGVLKLYQASLDNLTNTDTYNEQAAVFKASLTSAPEQTRKLQKDLAQLQQKLAKQKSEDFSQIPLPELEQRLIIEKDKIITLDEQLKQGETELAVQNNRPQAIREQTLLIKQNLADSANKLEASLSISAADSEVDAKLSVLKTQIAAQTAELKMLDVEAVSNPARVELLKTQQQLLSLQKSALMPVIQAIENLVSDLRLQRAKEMQDALSQTERELSGKHVLIQKVTRENIQYSRDLQNISSKIDVYNEQKAQVDTKSAEMDSDFKSAEKKISLAGLSPTLGKILREQRRNLANFDDELELQAIQNETALTSLDQFKVEDQLKLHNDVDAELKKLIAEQVDQNLPIEQRMMIQAELRVLINNQKDLLNKLLLADTTYLRSLGDLDFAMQQMSVQAKKFALYLDERLLWVPSSEAINAEFIKGLYSSSQWLLSPYNWLQLSKDATHISFKHPFFAGLAVISLALVFFFRNWAKQQLTLIAKQVEKIVADSFSCTIKALLYTLILVAPVPLLMYLTGVVLNNNFYDAEFSKAIGLGLQSAAYPWFFLQFFYRLTTDKGIARKHFQWHQDTASLLCRQLAWLRFVSIPGQFIVGATSYAKAADYGDNLGRLALLIVMLAIIVFLARLLKPSTGLVKDFFNNHPNNWISRSRYVWYGAFICAPLIIIGFAVAGYYLSALELQQKFVITLRLFFITLLLHELGVRWLTLVNRQLAIKNARQKRRAAQQEKAPAHQPGPEESSPPIEEPLIDIPKINAQTLKMLHVALGFGVMIGFWMIWKNILPAFSFLDNIVLWQHQVTAADQQTSLQPTTLTNLVLASLYVFVAVVSVRNFSGVMELLVFRRFAIEAGGRYAVNQIAKYVLVSIGFIFVANELGGSWTQVQWLVAALSVGLGFGLQEIFANMVSGIILLFERPIRIGDTVTIGNVDGRVNRIQMRATTLIDVDQKELIVPNKTFITSQLVNWTLSDSITRVVIPVGVAYDSDVDLALKIMRETVKAHPLVLAEPEPQVLLLSFGDSALNFSIRIYVNELGNRLKATHELLMQLEKAFREHEIEIPFPQREVHVRHSVEAGAEGIIVKDAFGTGNSSDLA